MKTYQTFREVEIEYPGAGGIEVFHFAEQVDSNGQVVETANPNRANRVSDRLMIHVDGVFVGYLANATEETPQ